MHAFVFIMKFMKLHSAALIGRAGSILINTPVLSKDYRKKGYFINIRSLS